MKRREVLTATALAFTGCLGGDAGTETGGTDTQAESNIGTSATRDTPTAETSARESETRTDSGTRTRTKTAHEPTATTEPTSTERTDDRDETDTTGGVAGITSRNFTVESTTASPDNEASVRFAEGGSRVVVTGTIAGSDGCQTAVLDSVEPSDSGLEVTVATENDAGAGAVCSQALVGIEYRLVMTVETPPESVRVVHRGGSDASEVATVERDG
jgi:hypothetical protein